MADYTYEIAWWPAPEAVKKDLAVYKPVTDVVARYTGLPLFTGISVEKEDLVQITTWKDTATHGAFTVHQDHSALLKDHSSLFPLKQEDATVYHTHLNADPLPILQAPIVEHAFLTPKEGVEIEDLRALLRTASDQLANHTEISYGSVTGTIEERPDQIVVLAGWKSLEAHMGYSMAPGSPAEAANAEIREKIKAYTLFHVSYTRQA